MDKAEDTVEKEMMFFFEFLMVLALALLATAVVAVAQRGSAPRPSLLWLFTILLFGTWALGVWLRPIGPPVRGFYWGTYFAAISIVVLLLAAATTRPGQPRKETREDLKGVELRPLTPAEEQMEREREESAAAQSLGFLFWTMIAVSLVALMLHYFLPGQW